MHAADKQRARHASDRHAALWLPEVGCAAARAPQPPTPAERAPASYLSATAACPQPQLPSSASAAKSTSRCLVLPARIRPAPLRRQPPAAVTCHAAQLHPPAPPPSPRRRPTHLLVAPRHPRNELLEKVAGLVFAKAVGLDDAVKELAAWRVGAMGATLSQLNCAEQQACRGDWRTIVGHAEQLESDVKAVHRIAGARFEVHPSPTHRWRTPSQCPGGWWSRTPAGGGAGDGRHEIHDAVLAGISKARQQGRKRECCSRQACGPRQSAPAAAPRGSTQCWGAPTACGG